jgi:hypothetical protein
MGFTGDRGFESTSLQRGVTCEPRVGRQTQRTRFEIITERKLRRRQLIEDGNVEITGRDVHEKTPPAGQRTLFESAAVLRV